MTTRQNRLNRFILITTLLQFTWTQARPLSPLAIAPQIQSYAEIWFNVRDRYPKDSRALIDAWVLTAKNGSEKMPLVSTTIVKDYEGEKYLRAIFDYGEKSSSFDLNYSSTNELLINKKTAAQLQASNLDLFVKNLSSHYLPDQIKLSRTLQELDTPAINALSAEDRAYYFINQRLLLELSQKVLATKKKTAAMNFYLQLLLRQADAAEGAKKCFNQLGYISHLDANAQCPNVVTPSPRFSQISCEAGGQLCNPQYYGLARDSSSQGLCLSSAEVAAGKTCGDMSPLKTAEDVKNLMASLMRVKPEGGTGEPTEILQQALAACEESGLKASSACAELMARKVAMNSFMVETKANDVARPPGEVDRALAKPKTLREPSSLAANSRASANDCGVFCTLGSWLTSDIAIKSYLVLGGGVLGYLLGRKNAKKTTVVSGTTAAATTGTTAVIGSPTLVTTPDYTGGVQ